MPQVANTTGTLQRLIESAARKRGVDPDEAARIAFAAVESIVENYGGCRLFIPMFQAARTARDSAIRLALLNGETVEVIAKRFGLRVRRVRSIDVRSSAGQAGTAAG